MSTFLMIVLTLLVLGFVAAIWLFLLVLFLLACGLTLFSFLFVMGMVYGMFSNLFLDDRD